MRGHVYIFGGFLFFIIMGVIFLAIGDVFIKFPAPSSTALGATIAAAITLMGWGVNSLQQEELRKTEKKNLMIELAVSLKFMYKWLNDHFKAFHRDFKTKFEPILDSKDKPVPDIKRVDSTVFDSILPKLDILEPDIIFDFIKLRHDLNGSNFNLESVYDYQREFEIEKAKRKRRRKKIIKKLLKQRADSLKVYVKRLVEIEKEDGILFQINTLVKRIDGKTSGLLEKNKTELEQIFPEFEKLIKKVDQKLDTDFRINYEKFEENMRHLREEKG